MDAQVIFAINLLILSLIYPLIILAVKVDAALKSYDEKKKQDRLDDEIPVSDPIV